MTQVSQARVAHFLLLGVLSGSPPNNAIKRAYNELGYDVDEYAPDAESNSQILPVSYGLTWIVKQFWRPEWRRYSAFSCTSEDPVAIAGLLALIWRKPLIFISDEIKSGSYRGDRPEYFKRLCRWLMRKAALTIVNDQSRVTLQREYANLNKTNKVIVYPGCFVVPPEG
ncbi:MAG: hypothetical protein KJP04_01270, partial [Arenicella sp.]|nr:hypothetical protein [Arenicella sp.]